MRDTLTVMWKERRMLFRYRGGRMRFVLTLMTPVLLAFYVSWQAGVHWVNQPAPVFPCVLVAVLAVILVIPESFAGERERHTLETLLATRLGDASILWGKLGLAITFAFSLVLVVLVLGLITANFFHYRGTFLMYSARNLVLSVGLSMLFAVLVAALGVIVSLRSETVQEATQTLTGIVLAPPILLGMMALPFRRRLIRLLEAIGDARMGLLILLGFSLLIVALLLEAHRRFRRSHLLTGSVRS